MRTSLTGAFALALAAACSAPASRADALDVEADRRAPANEHGESSTLLAAVVGDGGAGDAGSERDLEDVRDDDPLLPAIRAVLAAGIAEPCAPRRFCPNDSASRRDAVTWTVRAVHGTSFSYPVAPVFADVGSDDPAFAYVQRAAEDGLVAASPGAAFAPDEPAVRAAMAVFVVRALAPSPLATADAASFLDVPSDHWAFAEIEIARDRALTSGCDESAAKMGERFCPSAPASRAALAAWIHRAVGAPAVDPPSPATQ